MVGAAVPPRGREPRACPSTSQLDPQSRPQHRHRLEAPAAGAEEPAVERLQVHRAGRRAPQRLAAARRLERRPPGARAGADRRRLRGRPTPASASRPRSSGSSSRRSSRPTPAPAASTAAPASAWRSAASWRTCSAARSSCAARPASGSTFTLYLPLTLRRPVGRRPRRAAERGARRRRAMPAPRASAERAGRADPRRPRRPRSPATRSLLIVEDDPHYARILVDLARDKGFKVLVAMRGAEALALARAVPARPPSRSTSSCPTCSAGRC